MTSPKTAPHDYELIASRLAYAVQHLPSHSPETLHPDSPTSSQALFAQQLRAAGSALALAQSHKGYQVTREQRAAFLVCLAAGLGVGQAADVVGCSASTLHRMRRRDKAFAEEWNDALEVSLDPIDARLTSIALYGKAESMATVRAAELLRRGRSRSERRDLQQAAALELTQKDADGVTRTIKVISATPLPE